MVWSADGILFRLGLSVTSVHDVQMQVDVGGR